ncbi:MAG: hypothetical protein MUE42_02360, partial [Opitutaceae bacterium]|nr:hypothetical protein [Opitutaceae bacterium]
MPPLTPSSRIPWLSLFAWFLAFGAPATSSFAARTWFVSAIASPGGDGANWSRAFDALAPALAAAAPGDAIWLRAGTYDLDESVHVPSGVSLFGGFAGTEDSPEARRAINFANETTLRLRRAGASVAVLMDASDVRLDGLTFTGANGKPGVVLVRCAPTVVLANCRITRNSAPESGAGLSIRDRSQPRLHNV